MSMNRLTRILLITFLVAAIPIFAFAASTITFTAGSRYTSSASGNYISGNVSNANGQYVVLYNSQGKVAGYTTVDGSGNFSLATPTLNKGPNIFYVKSLKRGEAEASAAYKVNLNYSTFQVSLVSYTFADKDKTANIGARGDIPRSLPLMVVAR